MEKIVFENDIVVPRLSLVRCRYEVALSELSSLLAGLQPSENPLCVTAEEVRDYLCNKGQLTTVTKIQGSTGAINKLIDELAKSAWLNDLPWKLDQVEGFGIGEEKFHECVRAYIMPDDDHPLGLGVESE